jgi:hypothetical protein
MKQIDAFYNGVVSRRGGDKSIRITIEKVESREES